MQNLIRFSLAEVHILRRFPIGPKHAKHVLIIEKMRVLAIYQILLGWNTCEYYFETDELPNPRPTQPKKNEV